MSRLFGLEARGLERVADVRDQVALLQVTTGYVDGDAQALARRNRLAPLLHPAAGVHQHPAAESDDLARLFCHRDELRGHQPALLRMLPAHQRLDAEELGRLEVDDRLEFQEELAAGQRLVQVVLEPQALAQLFLHARVEHDVPSLAGGLGVVHRDVRVAQDVLGVVAWFREGDTDAGGHQQLVAVDRERLPESVGDRGGDLLSLLERRDALEQHRELVAAEPCDRVGRARALHQPLRGGLQQPVADVVSERSRSRS